MSSAIIDSPAARHDPMAGDAAAPAADIDAAMPAAETEPAVVDAAPPGPPPSLIRARRAFAARRRRQQVFGDRADLFGEPAWDMLLDLYIALHEDKPVTVSNACLSSGAATTTGLRWVATLAERGLVERIPDPKDGRRYFVRLTAEASALVERALE
ncbi:MarR family transcriptional regulator [Sphingomonas sp. S-NIH.Pt15_0812]|jgi:hypothetical protein|nr:MarR family transcriptional regulator [Sphingomonas sp. S-NIH.Pt15_0812]